MNVIFVRHGESEANVADFINDDPQRPVNLTEFGRQQAGRAAALLNGVAFTHAFASEFPRAQQTAAQILQHHRCELQIDARLNERKSGMDGLPTCTFNNLVQPDPIHIRPPLGENFLEQTERLHSFLQSLEALPSGATVLAVSHEYPLRSILMLAGVEPDVAVRQPIRNCGTVTIQREAGDWLLVSQLEE